MRALCGWFDIKPQAHYQLLKRQHRQATEDEKIVAEVQRIRRSHTRIGCRKLLVLLQPVLAELGIKRGRDRLFDLLRQTGLLVKPKRRYTRTTVAGTWRCENLLPTVKVDRPNVVWVSDITYIETESGFAYLSLVTDLFSRRIIGFDLSTSLAHEGAKRAFDMSVKTVGKHKAEKVIHHSDRGVQYTSRPYRKHLAKHKVRSSMGATGNCYDNAVAERVNGIVKLEYGLGDCFVSLRQAKLAVIEAVWLYNHERPHLSLNMRTPDDAYHDRIKFSLN